MWLTSLEVYPSGILSGQRPPPCRSPGREKRLASAFVSRKLGSVAPAHPLRMPSSRSDVVRRMIESGRHVSASSSSSAANFTDAEVDEGSLFASKCVLVVDDSKLNRKLVSRLLETCTVRQVDEAEDGLVCVAKVRASLAPGKTKFDIVLMDVPYPAPILYTLLPYC